MAKNSQSNQGFKAGLDVLVDPTLFFVAANSISAYGGDKLLDYISKNTDTYEGLAMMGVYAGMGATAIALNKFVIFPITKKIAQSQIDTYHYGKHKGALSWIRTIAQFGAAYALYMNLNMANVTQNYAYDANRVIDAFSRKGTTAHVIARKIDKDIYKPIPQFKLGSKDSQLAGMIEGKNMTGMFSLYTGISGTVNKKTNINFKSQLEKMWKQKLEMANDDDTREVYKDQVKKYTSPDANWTKMTFTTYLSDIRSSINTIKENIDWHKIGELKGLKNNEVKLLGEISELINERDLAAYGLTELMPGTDGEVNIGTLDFLLRNAGREYVELIPALGDSLTSFGLYQFTNYALYDNLAREGEERGASKINLALPEKFRIPSRVKKLKGNDHHKAAYLFAINNIADMISQLNRRQFTKLEQNFAAKMSDIANFIATSHHLPKNAIQCANEWLNDNAESTFSSHCDNNIRTYSRKTSGNMAALYQGIESDKSTREKLNNTTLGADSSKFQKYFSDLFNKAKYSISK